MTPPASREPATAVDNDIILKAACYRASSAFWAGSGPSHAIGILGQARYVVAKRIRRTKLAGTTAGALAELESILDRAIILEPGEYELRVAADVEALAARGGHQLDPGESQLAAIASARALPALETGDKRGIRALDALLDEVPALRVLIGRIWCLEQLVEAALDNDAALARFYSAICDEPDVDVALTMCFACYSPSTPSLERVSTGLMSYIADLRRDAPRVLAP